MSFEKEVQDAMNEIQNEQSSQPQNVGSAPEELQDQLSQLESFAALDPSVRESAEYKDLITKMNEFSSQATSEDDDDEDEDYEDDSDDEDESEEDEDEEVEDADNPFLSPKAKKKAKEIPVNFDVPKEFLEIMEKNFGVKELPTFLNSVVTWRQQAQEAAEIRKTHEALSEDIAALPYEIKMQIDAWIKGEDFLSPVLNMKRLSWDDDFVKQDVESLVQHYLPEQYDELLADLDSEQVTEEEFMKQINLLAKSTKQSFDRDKQALKTQRDEYATRKEQELKQFKKSALVSVDNLSKAYPDFSKSQLSKIRDTLVEGKSDELFYNPDGTYKAEAAELIAYAMYGKKILESVSKKAERRGETKANLEITDKSPKSIRKNKSTEGNGQVPVNEVQHLMGLMGNKSPYV